MKRMFVLGLVLLLLNICGCSDSVRQADIAGKTFCYEKEGFCGDFTITLNKDGTASYCVGMLSSYVGSGTWTLEEDILTISDDPFRNRFQLTDGTLVFLADDSTNFMHLKVSDGERFFPMES